MNRGEVWWIDFGEPFGSEAGYQRPGVIVSSDRFNSTRLNTLHVVGLTTNLSLGAWPGNVEIGREVSGLPKDSVANVTALTQVDKRRLVGRVGQVDLVTLQQVERGLRLVLDL